MTGTSIQSGRTPQPKRLGGYEILDRLGAGGAGVVYKARDLRLNRSVALKVLTNSVLADPVCRTRLLREARATCALSHPNIVTVYGLDSDGDVDFLVMEYLPGPTLEMVLSNGPLAVETAVSYAAQIADALDNAHDHGIVHLDLKPSNVIVNGDGSLKVLDFGLARRCATCPDLATDDETRSVTLSAEGVIKGTQYYMSPEQALGMPGDRRSDVFSLGVLLYQMLSGRRPIGGPTLRSFIHNLELKSVPPLAEAQPDLPDHILHAVSRALEKDPDARFQTMADFRRELLSHVAALPQPEIREKPSGRAVRRPMRRTWAVAASGLLVALLGWLTTVGGMFGLADSLFGGAYETVQKGQALLSRYDRPGNIDQAEKLVTGVIKRNPGYAPAHATLGEVYAHKFDNNPDPHWLRLAKECSQRAVSLDDQLASGHLALGRALLLEKNYTEATRELDRALMLDPGSWRAYTRLAQVQAGQGANARAEQTFRKALELGKGQWLTHALYGLFLYKTGRFAECAAQWSEAAAFTGDNDLVYRNLGAAYHQMDRREEAAAAFQKAIEIAPTPMAYSNLGTMLYYQGRFHEAAASLEKAVNLGPNVYTRWGNLADVLRLLPDSQDKSAEAYRRAIQLVRKDLERKPADVPLSVTLALFLVRSGDKQEAARVIAEVAKSPSASSIVHYKSALVWELLGERGHALASLSKAIEGNYSRREIELEPDLVALRSDPRYHKMLAR